MWIILFLIFSSRILDAQNMRIIDSLELMVSSSPHDTSKIEYLNELSWQWRKHDFEKALSYANHALEISRRVGKDISVATSINRIGEIFRLQGRYLDAIEKFRFALQIEKNMSNSHGIARSTSQLAILFRNLGQYDSALIYAKKSLNQFRLNNNLPALGRSYSRISTIFKKIGKYGLAIAYADSALTIQLARLNEEDVAHTYLSLGNLYAEIGYIDSARNQYIRSLTFWESREDDYEIARVKNGLGNAYYLRHLYDSALQYFKESASLKKQLGAGDLDVTYNNVGNVYSNLGELDSALHYYIKSLKIKKMNNDLAGLSLTHANIGILHKKNGDLITALQYFEKSIEYLDSNDFLIQIEIYDNISDIYSSTGQPEKALYYKDMYLRSRDTLEQSFRNAVEFRRKFEQEKSRSEILERDQEIQSKELAAKNSLIAVLILVVLIIFMVSFFFIKSKNRRNRLLLIEKDKDLAQQKVVELLKDQEVYAMNAMIEGQEGERKRIAQDLHDRLGSILTTVKLHFKSVEESIEELKSRSHTQYEKANELLDEACEEVRKIAHDMDSGLLSKFGLIAALKSLAESVTATRRLDLKILTFGLDEKRFEYEKEIELYRIIQELLSNTLKHAKASEMNIQLIKKEDNLNLIVDDNGIGFDYETVQSGMGLKNVLYRSEKLNGDMKVDSGKGNGTTITIDFSLKKDL
ncbi:MAG: sensor histidine kinase [Cyclobacteriaceae bacterium]